MLAKIEKCHLNAKGNKQLAKTCMYQIAKWKLKVATKCYKNYAVFKANVFKGMKW